MMSAINFGAMGLYAVFAGIAFDAVEDRWKELPEEVRESFRNQMRAASRALKAHGYSINHASDLAGK